MRLFEIFLIILLFAGLPIVRLAPSAQASPYRKRKINSLEQESDGRETGKPAKVRTRYRALVLPYLAALLGILTAHLLHEGPHWQMAPAYLAVPLLMLLLIKPGKRWTLRALAITTIVILTITSCCLATVLPMFELPKPTGMYAVGTRILPLTDLSRREDSGSGVGQRELVVQLWYPAQRSRQPLAPYRRLSETSPGSSYQSVDWTIARYGAPPAAKANSFPLVLYNPGWNGRRTQNTALNEELASHGYIVAAIDHPYNSGPVQLGDGRVIKPASTPELSDESTSKAAIYQLINREVEKETDDTLFVLSRLKQLDADPSDLLYDTMDLSKIAAIGYSLGGAVAAETAYRDMEIKAVVDLDTPLYGKAAQHGIVQPFLFLGEDLPLSTPGELSRMSFGQRRDVEMDQDDYAAQLPRFRRPGDFQLSIRGTLHSSFQDGIFFSPLRSISGAGSISPRRLNDILRQYTVAFLDQSLRGVQSKLLKGKASPFPEAKILYDSVGSR